MPAEEMTDEARSEPYITFARKLPELSCENLLHTALLLFHFLWALTSCTGRIRRLSDPCEANDETDESKSP